MKVASPYLEANLSKTSFQVFPFPAPGPSGVGKPYPFPLTILPPL